MVTIRLALAALDWVVAAVVALVVVLLVVAAGMKAWAGVVEVWTWVRREVL